ncbi:MAG TPA: 5'-3' exonuclease [Actinomycetota bacterium]|nr:5'-3' exonuclease [Actinomycetota bacterium]
MAAEPLTLLVDAPSLLYRALFSTPDTVRSPSGTPINAVYGFLNMLAGLVAGQRPDFLACADDADWRPAWRVALIESYKFHRTVAGSPAVEAEHKLAPQVPVLQEVMAACGVPLIGCPGFEAEDVIGTLAARTTGRVGIFSGDRDLFQLVEDPNVRVLYPRRGTSDLIFVDEAYLAQTYGIPPRAYGDFAILRGDASDGLPGVRGIGEKSAAALVSRYGSLAAILEAVEAAGERAAGPLGRVRMDRDYVGRADRVVRIRTDAPLGDVTARRVGGGAEPIGPAVWGIAERHGLGGPVGRLIEALS